MMARFSLVKHLHVARFARIEELESLASHRLEEVSLLLGTTKYRHHLQVQAQPTRRELGNVLVVAPTRGGKGLLATSQLLSWKHSVVVNDIKGELFTQTAGYRSTLGPVFVIDPTGVGHRYDPLLGKHTEDELLSSATQLLYDHNESEKVFTQRAINMLTQVFRAARLEKQPVLPYVRQMLRLGLTRAVETLQRVEPDLATQFLDVPFEDANFENRFMLDAWGTLTARLKPLLTETVVRCFSSADVTPNELLTGKRPVTVYLRWTERDLLALSPLVRLLWGSLLDELVTVYDRRGGKDCRPVLMLIDEAGRTAIPSLADHATTVVGRGISLWVAIQSLSQLEAIYGKDRAQILRDNMETQLYYRPSNQDTAEYLERCLGKKSGFAESHTKREGSETSEGQSEQGVALLTAWEIKQLHDDDVIAFHRRLPPFRAKRMTWQHWPILADRRGIPPPTLQRLPDIEPVPMRRLEQEQLVYQSTYIDPDVR